jgi:hypothetical protein
MLVSSVSLADRGKLSMLGEPRLDPEPREHDDLRGDGQNGTDDTVCHSLDQRHGPALPHRRLSRNAVKNSAARGGTIALL